MSAKLSELAAFASVARHLSFQKAAYERGVSRSAISHSVAGLERSLGVRLLNRDSRNVTPTDAGQVLYERLGKAFGDIDDALDHIHRFREAPIGKLRITAMRSSIVSEILGPVVGKLANDYPGLSIEIVSDDRQVDLVAEGFDAGVRLGEQFNEEMIAVKLRQSFNSIVVGSPSYIASHPPVLTPQDLHDHSCIRLKARTGGETPWRFAQGEEQFQLNVRGPVLLDSQDLMIAAALAGAGLAYVFESKATPHLEAGRLVRLLDGWYSSSRDLFLYYPSRRQISANLRALISALKTSS